jgi:hypothetical protein
VDATKREYAAQPDTSFVALALKIRTFYVVAVRSAYSILLGGSSNFVGGGGAGR